jgi:hypothetical protein
VGTKGGNSRPNSRAPITGSKLLTYRGVWGPAIGVCEDGHQPVGLWRLFSNDMWRLFSHDTESVRAPVAGLVATTSRWEADQALRERRTIPYGSKGYCRHDGQGVAHG